MNWRKLLAFEAKLLVIIAAFSSIHLLSGDLRTAVVVASLCFLGPQPFVLYLAWRTAKIGARGATPPSSGNETSRH